jgi:hypothetical protein
MAKRPKGKTRVAQVKSATFEVRYPIGLVTLELLMHDGQGSPPYGEELRLILQPDEARQLAGKLQALAVAMETMGGEKQ